MIHEYIEDRTILTNALETAHGYVRTLTAVADRLVEEARRRGWA